MYEDEHVNRYNKAASHGLCVTSKAKHIYDVELVYGFTIFELVMICKIKHVKKYHKVIKT